jgi:hypothetical protein
MPAFCGTIAQLPLGSHAMPGRLYLIVVALAFAALAGCAAVSKGEERLLDETLETYASVIRWGNFEEAASFVDPETLKAHPISPVALERYHQVQVTAYNEQPIRMKCSNWSRSDWSMSTRSRRARSSTSRSGISTRRRGAGGSSPACRT